MGEARLDLDAILVLEDVVDVAAVLADFLRDRGHTVLVAHTGRDALATLADRPVGLVLLDLELPDMHGTAVMRRARRVDHPPEIVVITGHAALASAVEAVEAGAGGYIIKPVDLSRLGVIVDRILSRRRLQRDNERLTAESASLRRETDALLAVSSALGATVDLREAFRRVCRELTQLIGADSCAAYVHEPGADRLVALAGYRVPRELVSNFLAAPLPLREGGELLPPWRGRRPASTDDVAGDPRFAHEGFRRSRHQSGLLLPLVLDGEVAGAFYLVWWRARRTAGQHELALAEGVAAQAALRLRAARLTESARLHGGARPSGSAAEPLAAAPGAATDVARLKSDFVSFITHQLWTPLSGIKWMLELAQRDQSLSAETASYVADAGGAAERLIKLVDDLVAVSRLERGVVAIAHREVDLAELTRRALDDTAAAARARGLRFSLALGEEPVTALGDPRLLRQAVLNLLSNAIKYSPAGGEIAVDVRRDDEDVRWTVQDHGIGIPAAAVDRVFEKFYRADNAAQVETEGTGLGLYAVRLIVEGLGGRVWCESDEGHGATFALALPRPAEPATGHPPAA